MKDCNSQILSSIPNNDCCSHAFLNTILYTSSQVSTDKNSILINADKLVLNKFSKILVKFYPQIDCSTWDNFLSLDGEIYPLFVDFYDFKEISKEYLEENCCKLTILKTFFVTNGKIYFNNDSNVNSKGYNLEFVFKTHEACDICYSLLHEFDFNLKSITRFNTFVLYTKNSGIICDLLVLLGATKLSLEIQDSLTIRDIRNSANRQNNCFASNLDKSLNASEKQLTAINYILENYSIDYLDESLRDVALVRLANPDVSLNELKQLLNNSISRAGIKYKLDKIIEIYKNLKGEN